LKQPKPTFCLLISISFFLPIWSATCDPRDHHDRHFFFWNHFDSFFFFLPALFVFEKLESKHNANVLVSLPPSLLLLLRLASLPLPFPLSPSLPLLLSLLLSLSFSLERDREREGERDLRTFPFKRGRCAGSLSINEVSKLTSKA
jgi:hypothetical protein